MMMSLMQDHVNLGKHSFNFFSSKVYSNKIRMLEFVRGANHG